MMINFSFFRILTCNILVGSAVVLVLTFSSCTTTKESYYFHTLKKDTTLTGFVTDDFEAKIKVGDNLGIVATSLSKDEDVLFNAAAVDPANLGGALVLNGFIVKPNGTVQLHKLGTVQVEGLTRKELAGQLQKSLLPFMKDPIVSVTFLNHKVTVMGAVKTPGIINFSQEQMPLIDVLIKSGDVIEDAKINDILVIRERDNKKEVKHLNLEDHSIFSSPWYYVQPNDIVYVMPDKTKTETEERRRRIQTTTSLIVSGVSLFIIILDRVLK